MHISALVKYQPESLLRDTYLPLGYSIIANSLSILPRTWAIIKL